MYEGRREEYRMQMDGRLNRLLSVLSEDLYINMETVADQMEVSERTARTLVSQLDELLCRNGAAIERRRGLGLRLCVKEPERYQEFIKGRTSALLPETGKERIEFILARLFAAASGVKSTEIRVQECIRQIRKALKPEGLSITCAVSSARYGLKEVSRCYQEAQEVLKLKYVRGENQDLYYQDIENETGHSYPEDILKTDLITPLKIGDTDALKKRLNELNLHLQKTGNDSYLYLQFIVGNLYSSLFQELSRDGISAKLIFEDPVEEYRKLLNCNTIQKAIAVLSDNLMRVCQYIMAQKQQSYSPPVLKALQYITANSQTPTLSLDDISDNVGLSSGRFSTLFKTETGMTFTDYLLKTRMEKAKELMLNPNKKIYEIALESGYDNIPYFSTAFRKYTGYSPSEYRNQIR